MASATFGFQNVVVSAFAFHTCVCLLKLMTMGLLTSLVRVGKGVFSNPEDCKAFGNSKLQPKFEDTSVERVRRNHLNDIENILPFILVGLFYCLSGPAPATAIMHFRVYTASKFLHTLAYQV